MKVYRDLASARPALGATAITIGKFDAVHFGHRWLLSQLRMEASRRGLAPVAVTFDRHPMSLFAPERCPRPLVSLEQKLALLGREQLAATVVLPFTRELAATDPLAFLERILVDGLGMRLAVVGGDFRFGARGAGSVELLREHADRLGYAVVVAPDEEAPSGRRASSSWVRELLDAGDVAGAAELLGRPHAVRGEVVHGAKRGRELGFPTANLSPELEGFIPADGVYAGWLRDGERVWPAAISVGDNPTFDGVPQKQVEAHLIDAAVDLYGRTVEVAFVERLRGMERFDGLEPLIARMTQDVDEARSLLASVGPALRLSAARA